jgi:hypothetical protein
MAFQVFISYRRDDGAVLAEGIHDRLERELGRDLAVIHVGATPLSVNFADAMRGEIAECDVLLALIGSNWLGVLDGKGSRRLDDPNDFVRMEIATALQRDIPIIPILLDGGKLPMSDQLPHA